ncbi:MAG: type II toxin-antitoxin system RelE/ParE family toxin [Candidatus Omnitrophica bacterium]|nr:type II toxin-antitoxin system RelE/ParE family toxin [Candidatus Omnitrophota bacterium]
MDKNTVDKKVIFYIDAEGDSPVEDFLDQLDENAKAKITARIEFLGKHWQQVRRPLVDYLEDGLYELRVQFAKDKVRVIYAYMFKNYIVLLHGIIKRSAKVPENDKSIAKQRRINFEKLIKEGRVKLP